MDWWVLRLLKTHKQKNKKNKETEKNKEERNDYNLPKAIGLY